MIGIYLIFLIEPVSIITKTKINHHHLLHTIVSEHCTSIRYTYIYSLLITFTTPSLLLFFNNVNSFLTFYNVSLCNNIGENWQPRQGSCLFSFRHYSHRIVHNEFGGSHHKPQGHQSTILKQPVLNYSILFLSFVKLIPLPIKFCL